MKTKSLFSKDFALVVIGQIISLFGNAILRFALPLYLLKETGSPTIFGIVTACSFLPMILLSFLGGVLADRVNKRNIMVALDFSTAFIIIVLYITIGKLPTIPLFIVVLMLLYGISGAYQPTVQASIPVLVSEENILPANATVNQISALAGLLGPIIGGMLFGSFGIIPILLISIACFIISAIMEIFIKIPCQKRNNSLGVFAIIKSDFHDSVSYMKKEKPLLIKIIVLVAIFNLLISSMIMVGCPILIVDTLKMNDQLLGLTQGILALGGLCGGILTGIFSKKLSIKKSHLLLLGCAISTGGMAIPFVFNLSSIVCYIVLTAMCFLIMGFATMFSVQTLATVQTETPPALVGKVIALMISVSISAQPIGQAIYGVLFDWLSGSVGILLLAVAVIAVIITFISKEIFQKA